MKDKLDARNLDDLVKGALLGDIWHDDGLKLVLSQAGVGIVDLLRLILRADCSHHGVTACQQCLEDVSCEMSSGQRAEISKGLFVRHSPAMKPEPPVRRTLVMLVYLCFLLLLLFFVFLCRVRSLWSNPWAELVWIDLSQKIP